ncbi:MAG TPA: hypothetical protein VF251_13740, partial [Pyrinomonadaceae bacterium]
PTRQASSALRSFDCQRVEVNVNETTQQYFHALAIETAKSGGFRCGRLVGFTQQATVLVGFI